MAPGVCESSLLISVHANTVHLIALGLHAMHETSSHTFFSVGKNKVNEYNLGSQIFHHFTKELKHESTGIVFRPLCVSDLYLTPRFQLRWESTMTWCLLPIKSPINISYHQLKSHRGLGNYFLYSHDAQSCSHS